MSQPPKPKVVIAAIDADDPTFVRNALLRFNPILLMPSVYLLEFGEEVSEADAILALDPFKKNKVRVVYFIEPRRVLAAGDGDPRIESSIIR